LSSVGLQLDVRLPSYNLFRHELTSGLLQSVGQLGPVGRRSKDQVVDPRTGSLKAQAPLLLLSKLDN
jgi:hypothetical protein